MRVEQLSPIRETTNAARVTHLAIPALVPYGEGFALTKTQDLPAGGYVVIDHADVMLEHPCGVPRRDEQRATRARRVSQSRRGSSYARDRQVRVDRVLAGKVGDIRGASGEVCHEAQHFLCGVVLHATEAEGGVGVAGEKSVYLLDRPAALVRTMRARDPRSL
jgi:hypothetical protein